jgi:hypothetical protein
MTVAALKGHLPVVEVFLAGAPLPIRRGLTAPTGGLGTAVCSVGWWRHSGRGASAELTNQVCLCVFAWRASAIISTFCFPKPPSMLFASNLCMLCRFDHYSYNDRQYLDLFPPTTCGVSGGRHCAGCAAALAVHLLVVEASRPSSMLPTRTDSLRPLRGSGRSPACRMLLPRGLQPTPTERDHRALHGGAENPSPEVLLARLQPTRCRQGRGQRHLWLSYHVAIVEVLLVEGASINATNTRAHCAAEST